jgi:hypothetical protein
MMHCSFAVAQSTGAVNPAVIPVDRLSEPWWAERHEAVIQAVKAHPESQLLLIGDSITSNYDKAKLPDEEFHPTWKQFYEPRKSLNLGFSGDTTANVLWRLDHGEIDGLQPKVLCFSSVLITRATLTKRQNRRRAASTR